MKPLAMWQMIKQSQQLSLIADLKIIRTVLQAQERTSERIVRAVDDAQRYDVLMASMKRAGPGSVVNASTQRLRGPTSLRTLPVVTARRAPIPVDPLSMRHACDSDGEGTHREGSDRRGRERESPGRERKREREREKERERETPESLAETAR